MGDVSALVHNNQSPENITQAIEFLRFASDTYQKSQTLARDAVNLVLEYIADLGDFIVDLTAGVDAKTGRRNDFNFLTEQLDRLRVQINTLGRHAHKSSFDKTIDALVAREAFLARVDSYRHRTNATREILRHFVRSQAGIANIADRAGGLVNSVQFAATMATINRLHFPDLGLSPARVMILDLFAVIVGEDCFSGRLEGRHFGGVWNGSSGMLPQYQDRFYQMQHAFAGIWIGYAYSYIGQAGANVLELLERDPVDRALYNATIPLGRSLNDSTYSSLASELRATICAPSPAPAATNAAPPRAAAQGR